MLSLKKLSVCRGEGGKWYPEDFSAEFEAGAISAIAGGNGSGKTSVALVLAGVLPRIVGGSWVGDVAWNRTTLSRRKGWPTAIAAAYASQDNSSYTVLGRVGDAISSLPKDIQCLARVLPLPNPETSIQQLSTGQRHLVDWLLCQGRRPDILILDEGLSSLDQKTAADLIAGSNDLDGNEERTLILIDQDRNRLQLYTDRIVELHSAGSECDLSFSRPDTAFIGSTSRRPWQLSALTISAQWAVGGVGFRVDLPDIESGSCVLLRGRVGAGKSTLLMALSGISGPQGDSGTRTIWETCQPIYLGTADYFVTAHPTIKDVLSRYLGCERSIEAWAVLAQLLQDKQESTDPGTLSFGQRRLLALMAILGNAQHAVALDEPDKGLDSRAQSLVAAMVAAFVETGGAVFVTSHNSGFVERLRRVLARPPLVLDVEPA